jgi:hypothetical protein
MTLRITLLGAAAALALPAAIAGAQPATPTAPPSPLTAGRQASAPIPPAETPVPAATAPAPSVPAMPDAAERAADAVEADAVAEAQGTAPPAAPVQAGPVALATAADVHAGALVHDQSGALVGTVETTDAGGAVVTTGTARARLQLSSFGRNDQGLVIGLTRAQFEAAAAAAATPG